MHIITADEQKRVRLPDADPNQAFDYAINPDRTLITLTAVKKVEPAPIKSKLVKVDGFTVIQTNRPIDEMALEEAYKKFA